MAKIIFVTGGERSGKSLFAMQLAQKLSDMPFYMATARIWDDDFAKRIERHKEERDDHWITIEEERHLSSHNLTGEVIVLDCITLWLTNIFTDHKFMYEKALEEAQNEWQRFTRQDFTLITVTNEIGMSLHADSESGRKFVELQGRMNQMIAAMADEAYLMVSGISVKIK
jgi:adenosylcobinamide kinase / adenosylcobinamide-phosphate guanylyltransferase